MPLESLEPFEEFVDDVIARMDDSPGKAFIMDMINDARANNETGEDELRDLLEEIDDGEFTLTSDDIKKYDETDMDSPEPPRPGMPRRGFLTGILALGAAGLAGVAGNSAVKTYTTYRDAEESKERMVATFARANQPDRSPRDLLDDVKKAGLDAGRAYALAGESESHIRVAKTTGAAAVITGAVAAYQALKQHGDDKHHKEFQKQAGYLQSYIDRIDDMVWDKRRTITRDNAHTR